MEYELFTLLDKVIVHRRDVVFVVVSQVVIQMMGEGIDKIGGMGKVVQAVEGLVGNDDFLGGLGNDAEGIGLGVAVLGGIGGKGSEDTV